MNALKSSLPIIAVVLLSGAGLLMASPVVVSPQPHVASASPVVVSPQPHVASASPVVVSPQPHVA